MNSDDVTCKKCGEVYPDLEAMTGHKIRECPECGEPRKLGPRKPPSDIADDFDEIESDVDDPWPKAHGSQWCPEIVDEDNEDY